MCDKGLAGVRALKDGQTMLESMTEQIFELQKEDELLKQQIKEYY